MNDRYGINPRRTLIALAVVAAVFLGIFIVFKLSFYVAPFIIALILSMLMEPFIRLLTVRLKLKRKHSALISLLLVLLMLASVLTLVIHKLITELMSLSALLPKYFSDIYSNITALIERGTDMYQWLPTEITGQLETVMANLSNSVVNIVKSIASGAVTTVISLPEALIFTLVTILSTYFVASDKDKIYGFFRHQLPESWIHKVSSIKRDMFSALFGYIRAQLILMSITFTELFIGFTFMHIKYNLLLAFLISIIDALPILGTGSVLIPWSLYSLLTGNIRLGISTFILYIVVLIVRQLTEPKVLGNQIGVYPLLTLMSMYAGLKILGFAGLILGPITFLLLKNIFSGIIKGRTIKEFLAGDTDVRNR